MKSKDRDSLLVSSDFSESNCTGPVPVGLLDTTGSGTRLGSGLSGSLGSDYDKLALKQREEGGRG